MGRIARSAILTGRDPHGHAHGWPYCQYGRTVSTAVPTRRRKLRQATMPYAANYESSMVFPRPLGHPAIIKDL